jgi:hypothetical protein
MRINNEFNFYKESDMNDLYSQIYKSIYDYESVMQNEFRKDEFMIEMQNLINTTFKKDNISPQKLIDTLTTNII